MRQINFEHFAAFLKLYSISKPHLPHFVINLTQTKPTVRWNDYEKRSIAAGLLFTQHGQPRKN
jgi:hypothetical protein